ncbi:MAG: hypothetical protein ACRDIB_19895, partial [Ardenticatenaceae bacterium]
MDSRVAQAILQDHQVAYCITNRDLKVVEVNAPHWPVLPPSRASLGRSLLDLVPELVGYEEVLVEILAGQLPRLELALVNHEAPDRTNVYLTFLELPYRDETGQIVGILHLV